MTRPSPFKGNSRHNRVPVKQATTTYTERIAKDDIRRTQPNYYLTPDNIIGIESALFYGADITVALRKVGIPSAIYMQWQSRAIQGERPYFDMFLVFESAKADFEIQHLKSLHLNSTIDNKASTFLLERTKSQRYAQRSYLEVTPAYVSDLRQLVATGAVTVEEILTEVGDIDEEYLISLYGIQALRDKELLDKGELEGLMVVKK